MATSTHAGRQGRLSEDFGTYEYALGDLLEVGPSGKKSLTECPLCAADPSRPRHHFGEQENRAAHIGTHAAGEVTSTRR